MLALFKLFKFLKNYRFLLILSIVILSVSVIGRVIEPKLIEWAIDYGIGGEDISVEATGQGLPLDDDLLDDKGENEKDAEVPVYDGDIRVIIFGGLGIFLIALVSGGLNFLSGYFIVKSSQGMSYNMRNFLYNKIMSFSFFNLDKWRTGELMIRLNSDVNNVRLFIRMGFLMMVQSITMIVGSLYMMFNTNFKLARVMLIVMPFILVLFFVFAMIIRPMFLKVRKKLDELNNHLQENLAGAKVVRAFSRQNYEITLFEGKNTEFYKKSLKVGYIVAVLFPLLFFVANISILISLWVGGNLVIDKELSVGQLVAFNNYAMMSTFPVLMLGMVLSFISTASASAQRIREILKEEPTIKEAENPITKDKLDGNIEFKNVSFHYGQGENALCDISFSINSAEKIGILGSTGSGKSSIANLIPRLYEVQEGEVLVDGVDVKKYSIKTLRRKIAMVLQESFLFSGSIKENLSFGKPDASQEELERAADIACAKDFILEKDNKWDEFIGERGVGLSGGQRQRMAIARAVVAQPDILILDDVTSSVDSETENKIFSNLKEYLKNRTTIIISQKISSVKDADKILLIDEGKIIGMGTHNELLKDNDVYKEIYETQFGRVS